MILNVMLVMLLSGTGVTLDQQPPRKNGKAVVIDAGTKLDLGQAVTQRRAVFMRLIKASFPDTNPNLKFIKVMWATTVVDFNNDAALVVVESNGVQSGMFFYFRSGEWIPIPEEFQ